MEKIVYRCPNVANCTLHKNCMAFTLGQELEKPTPMWLKCPELKKLTNGRELERPVVVTKNDRAA